MDLEESEHEHQQAEATDVWADAEEGLRRLETLQHPPNKAISDASEAA